jgi:endonuclease-3
VSRLERLLVELHRFYGALPSWPRDPFALFVFEVLSVHSTAWKREAAMAELKRVPALTPDSMARVAPARLEAAVALAGSYRDQRLRALRTGIDLFRRSPQLPDVIRGPLAAARRSLSKLPQAADAAAHRMLLFAADRPLVPVDAAVARVALRLGYGAAHPNVRRTMRSVARALRADLPPSAESCRYAYQYLSHHAGATCTEADPHCAVCPLLEDCPEGQVRLARPIAPAVS